MKHTQTSNRFNLIVGSLCIYLSCLIAPAYSAESTNNKSINNKSNNSETKGIPSENRSNEDDLALENLPADQLTQVPHEHYATLDVDILALNDEIKTTLDKEIRPIKGSSKRAKELHHLMFANHKWDINYAASETYTAQQTYDLRQGNCVSMAALYVAAARYVGLPAHFQVVTVEDSFIPKENYYLLTGHINAIVKLPRETVNVEFIRTFFDTDRDKEKKKRISDKEAFAEYHNNIGMELIEKKQFELAKMHMDKALDYAPKLDFVWSNYGVLHKFNGELIQAEEKYRKAIKLNRRNLSALTNLYVLLEQTERSEEALKIAETVSRHSKKNPYHLAKLAESSLANHNYQNSIKIINKAIRKNREEPHFYHIKAQAYYHSGNIDAALKALATARSISEKLEKYDDQDRYQKKLDALLSHK